MLLRIFSGLTFRHIGELTETPTQTIVSLWGMRRRQARCGRS